MNLNPLVSVIILNYKRLDELAKCLDSVDQQDYPNLEVIVVDNHSEEDVAGLVGRYRREFRLLELPANLGTCGGRNAGIRASHGEILITIDNDVTLGSPFEVSKTVKAFEEYPSAHVLAFRICDAGTGKLRLREWCHPRNWREFHDTVFETNFFGEGASAYRREVFDTAGVYWDPLFIGHEGYELGLRIMDHGFRILYCPQISVRHSMSNETRSVTRPFYFYTRNYVWIAYKDHGFLAGIQYLAPKLAMMAFFSFRAARPLPFLRGVWHGIAGLRKIERTPVRRATLVYIDELERWRPNWFQRWRRHRLETQL